MGLELWGVVLVLALGVLGVLGAGVLVRELNLW